MYVGRYTFSDDIFAKCVDMSVATFDISGVNLPLPADMTRPTHVGTFSEHIIAKRISTHKHINSYVEQRYGKPSILCHCDSPMSAQSSADCVPVADLSATCRQHLQLSRGAQQVQRCRYGGAGAEVQRCRGAEVAEMVQKVCRGAEVVQSYRGGAEVQEEVQRWKGEWL